MDYQQIRYECDQGVAVVTLCRPDQLNAYTPDMGEELVSALRQCLADNSVRAIVLTGAGRGFCAGADRAFLQGKVGDYGLRLGEETFITDFAAELAAADKPLIAAVNGIASGIGVTMTLPFDIRLASPAAGFDFPFVKLAVAPGFASSYFLPRLIGIANASDVLLNSRRLDADTALNMGLVQQIVSADQLLPRALSMANTMAEAKYGIVTLCKNMLRAGVNSSLQECMQRERTASQAVAAERASSESIH